MKNVSAGFLRCTAQVCLIAGAAMIVLSLSAILLPFVVGVALVAAAQWAANREASNAPLVVVRAAAC
jgi:hypothetical protein